MGEEEALNYLEKPASEAVTDSTRFMWTILSMGFCVWLVVGALYVNAFDRYEVSTDARESHGLVRGDANKYWLVANRFVQAIRQGESFSSATGEYRLPYLYPMLLALYGQITNLEFLDSEGRIPSGGKFGFLLLQALFYYFSLWFFYSRLKEMVPPVVANVLLIFLTLEPTILQYHTSFWTESVFLSLELLAFAFVVRPSSRFFSNLPLGFVLGLMCLQRPISTLYCLVVAIALIVQLGRAGLGASAAVFIPVLTILGLIGFNNYSRMGVFYVTPTQGLDGPLNYLANYVVADAEGGDPKTARGQLLEQADQIARERGLDPDSSSERVGYLAKHIKKDLAIGTFIKYPADNAQIHRISYDEIRGNRSSICVLAHRVRIQGKQSRNSGPHHCVPRLDLPARSVCIFRSFPWTHVVRCLRLQALGVSRISRIPVPLDPLSMGSGGWVGDIRYMVPALIFYAIYVAVALCWIRDRVVLSGRPKRITS